MEDNTNQALAIYNGPKTEEPVVPEDKKELTIEEKEL